MPDARSERDRTAQLLVVIPRFYAGGLGAKRVHDAGLARRKIINGGRTPKSIDTLDEQSESSDGDQPKRNP